jgi:hypothetical protein
MKKVALLLAFIFTVSSGFSQQRKKMRKAEHMTPEQRTTLTVKKLTLALDLDKAQARKVKALYEKMSKERTKMMKERRDNSMEKREKLMKIKKSSKDNADFKRKVEKAIKEGKLKKEDLRRTKRRRPNYEAQNKALDHMIALQTEMKKILTKEQYEKFKKLKKRRMHSAKDKMRKVKKKRRVKKSR